MKTKFKPGDKVVLVKPKPGTKRYDSDPGWVPSDMDKMVGKTLTIKSVNGPNYRLRECRDWEYHYSWLKPAKAKTASYKIIETPVISKAVKLTLTLTASQLFDLIDSFPAGLDLDVLQEAYEKL